MSDQLELRAGFDRRLIHPRGGSRRYLLCEVEAPLVERERSARTPIHLALVIDRSGSMQGGRLSAAKQAAKGVAQGLSHDDLLSIVVFDDEISVLLDGEAMDGRGIACAHEAIEGIHCGGTTNLFGGWLAGAECVARTGGDGAGYQQRVVVLSDGHANRGVTEPEEIAKHASELFRRGIVSSAVGIGDGYSPVQLMAIAENGGGNLHDAMRPEDIVDMVAGELGESLEAFADQVWLDLRVPRGAHVECWSGYEMQRTADDGWSCAVGSLASTRRRPALFAVDAPAGEVGDVFDFEVQARWHRPGGDDFEWGELRPLSLVVAHPRANAAQPRDVDLSVEIARLWQARIVYAASTRNIASDYVGAGREVDDQLRYFGRYVRDLPGGNRLLRELQRLRRTSSKQMSPRSSRELSWQASQAQKGLFDYREAPRPDWQELLDD